MPKKRFFAVIIAFSAVLFGFHLEKLSAAEAQKDYPVQPVAFTKVRIDDDFWCRVSKPTEQ